MFLQSASRLVYAMMQALTINEPPPIPIVQGERKNYRRTKASSFRLSKEALREIILQPSLAGPPRRRVRPGVTSPIFHP